MSKNKVRLHAGRDTWVNQNKPSTNYRGGIRLSVANSSGGKGGRWAFMSFNVKIPKNATVVKATLHLTLAHSTTSARTITVRRITQNWKQSKTTWANQPNAAAAGPVSVTRPAKNGTETWKFDVTSHMQSVANGSTWLGWRIESNNTDVSRFYSSESKHVKPYLEIEWDEAPQKPNDLSPGGGGFVSTGSPTLSWDFRDNRGSTGMGGMRVQLSNVANFSNIIHDSGTVNAAVPSYNLATASGWTPLTNSQRVYWRVMVKDTGNNWSPWSDIASFAYDVKGTLTIVGPSGNTVSDPSPTVAWSLTGKIQSQWQVMVRDSSGRELYDSGRYASDAQSWTIPTKMGGKTIIGQQAKPYTIVVRVWDNVNRSLSVGDDVMYEAARTVTYVPGSGTAPSTPVAVDNSTRGEPGITLRWTRAEAPDRYDIWRQEMVDGVYQPARLIDSDDPGDLVTGVAGSYEYTDYTARYNVTYRYRVAASVNGVSVESGAVAAKPTKKSSGIWLIDQFSDIRVQLVGTDEGTWEMGEESTTYTPVGSSAPRLVTQALRGYEGSISGQLMNTGTRSVYEQEQDLFELKATPGREYMLVLPDLAIPVVISNVVIAPTPHKETVREVSFNFYQQGSLSFRQTF